MRALIGLIVIVYLVGVGVALAPTISGKWNTDTASGLSASVIRATPSALAWPASAYRRLTGRDVGPPSEPQSKSS